MQPHLVILSFRVAESFGHRAIPRCAIHAAELMWWGSGKNKRNMVAAAATLLIHQGSTNEPEPVLSLGLLLVRFA